MSQSKYHPDTIRPVAGATIIDVAREAGVSYTTVSRVINEKNNVRPDKRERVLAAMERLGYVVNQHARSLAGGRSQMIGLLVHDLGTSYMSEIVRGIEAALDDTAYDLLLYTTHRRPGRESSYISQMSNGSVDGVILVSPRSEHDALERLQQRDVPHVLVDYRVPEGQSAMVTTTNWQGAYDATRYLLDLGHRRIGHIGGTLGVACTNERLAGYEAAMRDAGVAADPTLIRDGDFQFQQGAACAQQLLDLAEPPTAIFAANDLSAFGALETLRNRGLVVPDDMSVVGFDDIPPAAHIYPALTTVRQPLFHMGHAAMKMLLRTIDEQHSVAHIELPTELIVRQSCQALRLAAVAS